MHLARHIFIDEGSNELLAFTLKRFNLDSEMSVPTYASSLLLLTSSLAAWVKAQVQPEQRTRWLLLAAVLAGLSLDEAIGIHESAIEPIREWLGVGGFMYFAWVIPGAAFVALASLAFLPLIIQQESWLRLRLLAAGGVYVGGALGVEMVGGAVITSDLSGMYVAVVTIEEMMEIIGSSLFIYLMILDLCRQNQSVNIIIGSPRTGD